MPNRLAKQIAFAVEIDQLKQVHRQTWLIDQTRRENDAEHSWHFATMVLLLSEYAEPGIDRLRAAQMALLHDIVEIDAGDALVYDAAARAEKVELEKAAAERIFGILPDDQAAEYRALWEEYEAKQTPEAKFAAAIDRLQPLLHNYYTQGRAWREHGVTAGMVTRVNAHIAEGSPRLWEYVQDLIADAEEKGYLAAP